MQLGEIDIYRWLITANTHHMAKLMRQVPSDKWEFAFDKAAPSTKQLAQHAWSWLVCDRQHILQPNIHQHRQVPSPPEDQEAMCTLLEEEAGEWDALLTALQGANLDEARTQFGEGELNIRFFLSHMANNLSTKWGQFTQIYYALGYDGTEPYTAPMPNDFYGDEGGPREASD